MPPAVAVTVQMPAFTAVTVPPATVARPAGETLHHTNLLAAFAGSTMAVRVWLSPSLRFRIAALRLTLCTGMSCALPPHSARRAFRADCASPVL